MFIGMPRWLSVSPQVINPQNSRQALDSNNRQFHWIGLREMLWENLYFICIFIMKTIWVNCNISLSWIKAILGMMSLINHDSRVQSQWGRYNLPRTMVCQSNDNYPKSQLKSATKLLKEAMASPPLLGRSSANKSCKCRPCTIYTMWAPVDDS